MIPSIFLPIDNDKIIFCLTFKLTFIPIFSTHLSFFQSNFRERQSNESNFRFRQSNFTSRTCYHQIPNDLITHQYLE